MGFITMKWTTIREKTFWVTFSKHPRVANPSKGFQRTSQRIQSDGCCEHMLHFIYVSMTDQHAAVCKMFTKLIVSFVWDVDVILSSQVWQNGVFEQVWWVSYSNIPSLVLERVQLQTSMKQSMFSWCSVSKGWYFASNFTTRDGSKSNSLEKLTKPRFSGEPDKSLLRPVYILFLKDPLRKCSQHLARFR